MSHQHPRPEREDRALVSDTAFELVGNELRVAILRALWQSPDEAVSFSELRSRSGNPDSGQFNYHLNALIGTFVEQTDDGYKPRPTRTRVINAILAGTTGEPPELNAVPVDGHCPFCGGDLAASYAHERARIKCQSCGKIQMREWFPPASLTDRSPDSMVDAMDRWARYRTAVLLDGVCPDCGAKPDRDLFETRSASDGSRDYLRTRYECRNCQYECDVPIWLYVLLDRHPAVTAFYYRHGIDLTSIPIWELTAHGDRVLVTVDSTNPLRIDVTIPLDDEELCLTLDDQLEVVGDPATAFHQPAGD